MSCILSQVTYSFFIIFFFKGGSILQNEVKSNIIETNVVRDIIGVYKKSLLTPILMLLIIFYILSYVYYYSTK